MARRVLPFAWIFVMVAGAVLLKACGGDDIPKEDITDIEASVPRTIVVTSDAFAEGGTIPVRYTCEGDDVSPPLRWENVPSGTRSFVIIVDDPDAPGRTFLHWLVYAIPAEMTSLPEGVLPVEESDEPAPDDQIRQGINDFGDRAYGGPCPPRGDRPHRYHFQVLAIDEEIGVSNGAPIATVMEAIDGHVLAKGELTARFGR